MSTYRKYEAVSADLPNVKHPELGINVTSSYVDLTISANIAAGGNADIFHSPSSNIQRIFISGIPAIYGAVFTIKPDRKTINCAVPGGGTQINAGTNIGLFLIH